MRKNLFEDERMMLRVSDLYYNKNLSQQEIANKLKISRPTVSKLLSAARDAGIVTITVSDVNGRKYFQLEQMIEEKFGLKEVYIVDSTGNDAETKDAMGKAAAQYLSRILKDGDTVGVTMGTSVARIAPNFTGNYHSNLTFVPLIGGVGTVANDLHSNYLAEMLAKSYGGIYLPLHTPAMVSRKSTKTELLKENSIQRVFKKAARMDVALLGIGSPGQNSTVTKTGYITSQMFDEMEAENICGDICMKFYDEKGNINKFEENDKVMSIDLDILKNVKYAIGIAGGSTKARAIHGAINGGYINVLVTDYNCAQVLNQLDAAVPESLQ
ncbi:MAG: sugar-binding transcriptional regulator [Eubacteriaceae bacterium]|jgi:deoxyribonucleoside regulator